MRTLILTLLAAVTPLGVMAQTKTYTPDTAPRPQEDTILNARVVAVDPSGSLTIRGVDVRADGGKDEVLRVAPAARDQLVGLKPGMEVLLHLRGTVVQEIKLSVKSGGPSGSPATIAPSPSSRAKPATGRGRATPGATAKPPARGAAPQPPPATGVAPAAPAQGFPQGRPLPQVPAGSAPVQGQPIPQLPPGRQGPQGQSVPQVAASAQPVPSPQPAVSPQPLASPTPYPTPRPVGVPPAVGTPPPVLIPSSAPTPTPTPSPAPR
jgi:hypothetical protein